MNKCKYCGELIEIRNPTGNCDHLFYPELVNKKFKEAKKSSNARTIRRI